MVVVVVGMSPCDRGPRDKATAIQQNTWCFTTVGTLRAFFCLLLKKIGSGNFLKLLCLGLT